MYYFVINPQSQSGKGLRIWNRLETILKDRKIEYKARILDGPDQAAQTAAEICADHRPCTAVVLGGDGTINEFLNGLTTFEDITFGYIATGSANDFGRGMKLPSNPEAALEMILNPRHYRRINIGRTSSGDKSRSFAVSSGIGYDASVCYAVDNAPGKKIFNLIHTGKFVYLFHALRQLLTMKTISVRILIDDKDLQTYRNLYFAAVMNTKYEGGGFMFAPDASPSDDCLDLVFAEGLTRLEVLRALPTAFSGKHLGRKGIHLIRCRRAVIQCSDDSCVHTDGEHFGFTRKVTFSHHKDKLLMICG